MKKIGTKTLETKNLLLRKISNNDKEKLYNDIFSHEDICNCCNLKYFNSKETFDKSISNIIINYNNDEIFNWFIFYQDSPIGMIGVTAISNEGNTCDLGYQIIPKYQNKGYMTEALGRVLNFLLEEADFYRISVYYHGNNIQSQKVIIKCGLKYEGTFRSDYLKDGVFLDTVYYSAIKTDILPKTW